MSRYIDADILIGMIEAKADTLIQGKEAFQYIAKWIELLPSVDVVEVVRCKDCKHATFYVCKNDDCYRGIFCEGIFCEYEIGTDDENFFCIYGERKEKEE